MDQNYRYKWNVHNETYTRTQTINIALALFGACKRFFVLFFFFFHFSIETTTLSVATDVSFG